MALEQANTSNRLLSRLPAEDFALLADALEPIDLPMRMVLAEPLTPLSHLYFPDSGIGSVVARSSEGFEAEAGVFGRDGFAPTALFLGSDQTVHTLFMQVTGAGYRISSEALQAACRSSPALHRTLSLYVHTMGVQAGFTALSNAVHPVIERLARWLLMCHDRSIGDEMALTHDFLALMLAVRRPSVTTALHSLEGSRFIQAERGYITVRDRCGLEAFAADAYGQPEAEYARLLGPLR
ncbi:MAG: Crp family transcriptional regulator protein [Devosia sp.]|nr:Crp family transcriptional regulator protein [Devosia sp.]